MTEEHMMGELPRASLQQTPKDPCSRRILGTLLGIVVWCWLRSLRLTVIDRTRDRGTNRPWILVFWHGTQVPLLAWRRRRGTGVLVSHSRDGALQTCVMKMSGMSVVRGSTSRGAVTALLGLVRRIRREQLDGAFAVDGPKGPIHQVSGGAQMAARLTHGVLVPIGSAATPQKILSRAWDRFAIPWPFSRAVVVVGPEVAFDTDGMELAKAIHGVNAEAAERLRAV